MMADHWLFVLAAYGLAAAVLAGYWRHLVRRERELTSEGASRTLRTSASEGTRRPLRASPQAGAGEAGARSGEERS